MLTSIYLTVKIIFLYSEALSMLECALATANCLTFTEQEIVNILD